LLYYGFKLKDKLKIKKNFQRTIQSSNNDNCCGRKVRKRFLGRGKNIGEIKLQPNYPVVKFFSS